jgi:nucleoside-diphosphate-sugar epimerase
MKYIVFGNGFIGSNLTRKLRSENHFVITVDRNPPRHSEHTRICVHYIWRDISNLDNFPHQDEIDGVFQTCGMMPSYSNNNDEIFTYNSNINKAVINFCIKNNVKNIFFASSIWASNPINSYGKEKLYSEGLFADFAAKNNVNVKIGRISNLYGPNNTRGIIHDICKKVYESEYSIIVRDPNSKRTFLHIYDCIDGILKVMSSKCDNIVVISSDQYYTIHDIAKKIIDISGKEIKIETPSASYSGASYYIDGSSIPSDGWIPSISIEDGIKQVYQSIPSTENTT